MGTHEFGDHAEVVFSEAFTDLGFNIVDRDASSFQGREVEGIPGRQLPDLDFILEKEGLHFGVDIKNWLRFEKDAIGKIMDKVNLAYQLHLQPIIIARYADKDTIYNELRQKGVRYYIYSDLLVPSRYSRLSERANELMGYPLLAVDRLPEEKKAYLASKVLNF